MGGCGVLPRSPNVEWLKRWPFTGFVRLEARAGPGDLYHGTMIGEHAVGERNLRTGALQERSRDEHAESESGVLAWRVDRPAPPRQIGFADPLHDIRRKARTVVGNHDFDRVVVPPCIHFDLVAREIHGVFEDIANAIEDRGIAQAY